MTVLRATGKALRYLGKPETVDAASDAALGDWYANRVVVKRQPLLVLISSRSYLPIVVPAKGVRTLPDRLPGIVADRLERLGVVQAIRESERQAMYPVRVAKTVDRSVTGILVDYGRHLPYHLETASENVDAFHFAEERLQGIPWNASKRMSDVVFPVDKTIEVLQERWGG